MTIKFDRQAATYDLRTGLPEPVIEAIAAALLEMAAAPTGGTLLEIGAGTGQLGCALQRLPLQYTGLDISEAMLEQFRQRLPNGATARLLLADGNQRWPADTGAVHVVFSSRALHWLEPQHVVDELFRVASSCGAVLMTGHVVRQEDSVKQAMRKKMRALLRQEGFEGKSGKSSRREIFRKCCDRGAALLPICEAASWTARHAPESSLADWLSKEGLAGIEVPPELKQKILDRLRDWAANQFEDLQQEVTTRETYVLEGVQLPPLRKHNMPCNPNC